MGRASGASLGQATEASPSCAAIVVAGGRSHGSRRIHRTLALLGGKPVIRWTLERFQAHGLVREIVLVAPVEDLPTYEWIAASAGLSKLRRVVAGGAERQDSDHHGLRALGGADVVVIHDGAHPFVSADEISLVVAGAVAVGAAAVGQPCTCTLRRSTGTLRAAGTISRHGVWCMGTPQAMRRELAVEAFERAAADGFRGSDAIELVERLGRPVQLLRSSGCSFEITTPEHLRLAEALLGCGAASAARMPR